MNNVKLVDDTFTFADLNIAGLPHFDYSIYRCVVAGYGCPEIVCSDDKFTLHKSLIKGTVSCTALLEKIDKILGNKGTARIGLLNPIPLDEGSIKHLVNIKNDLESGFITINNIKIDLNTYEPNGEYAEIYTDKIEYTLYNVKKYYSIIEGQYTFFLNNGKIKSIDGVKSMTISKDVRLTKEELERLWKS